MLATFSRSNVKRKQRPSPSSRHLSNGSETVRIRLKGINFVSKTLRDGTTVTYWYAWKGGPRLDGEPGAPEFVASYNRAVASIAAPPRGLFLNVLVKFQQTEEFRKLAPRTQADYQKIIDKKIEPAFGDLPIAALRNQKKPAAANLRSGAIVSH